MQFNYYFLKQLSKVLGPRLINLRITAVFSQNKDELILAFEGEGTEIFIKANLDSEASLLSFPADFARAKKNSVDLFEELVGLKVYSIRQFDNERSFSILFENHFELLFKLHGRHANLILFKKEVIQEAFKKNIEHDQALILNDLNRKIDQSDEAIVRESFDLFPIFPTFDKHIKNHLKSAGFYDTETPKTKLHILHELLDQLHEKTYYLTTIKDIPKLLLFKPEGKYEVYNDPIVASNALAREFFTNHGVAQLKNKLLGQVRKEIKKSLSYLSQTDAKLDEIMNRRGYGELANILMANLHLKVNPADKQIELFDFYTNEQITIKLKPHQSLQLNAENLYRKAKNQAKEVEMLKKNIEAKQQTLAQLQAKELEIEALGDIKALRTLTKPNPTQQNHKETTPFMEFSAGGFQVYVGKNAKNNDVLTQKFAKKDDLWLHARDVSGSHAIIRNPNGVNIPMHIIEKVAQVAAWYSKRKSDTLCPVIYTPKKFVRKPKGALPGQVLLSKEEVILVPPNRTALD
ncbi:NFACT RNA binding domain-containing protein [Reichenbachiella carrageenanivorans]|uniref:NFACT RNA binding domain-containing protein n=1 Tax=Reichenbachiella carrageenanivorans TaxID=2979869 RepID=A0ABY6CXF0_9BACT|nr:NFACT RNA binding domain-containing protein [Reichenbachiella carrageenanivorans]UXX78592.1 NFACT RNA binding domain-containing protein [Reichenbachiella carrageenanivorans]